MKKFNIFNWSKKDKNKCSDNFDKSTYSDINLSESNDSFEFKDGLDYFVTKKKNYETAEDAISIRSSVDCKNRIKFTKSGMKSIMQRVGLAATPHMSKSFKHMEQALSYHNLSGTGSGSGADHGCSSVTGTKLNHGANHFSRSMIIYPGSSCTAGLSNMIPDHSTKQAGKFVSHHHNLPLSIPEDADEPSSMPIESGQRSAALLHKASSLTGGRPVSPLLYGITTAAIISRHESTASCGHARYRNQQLQPHQFLQQAWIETEAGRRALGLLSKAEIQRQNIVYEMLTGEMDALDDLHRVVKNYKQPMEKLRLLSQVDSFNLFYVVEKIIPVYESFVRLLEEEKDENGVIRCVGNSLIRWSDMLDPIIKYCTHLYFSKSVLEEKRKVKEVGEFLQKCSASKFSRKLDLWDFLDHPRSRLMKYPLLIDRILKSTESTHPDFNDLAASLKRFEKILSNLDAKTGEEMCNYFLDKIEFSEQSQYIQLVKSQKALLFEGSMKVGRSVNFQKVHAFLFEEVLVLTKPFEEENVERIRYIVYGNPLPTSRLVVEDIKDGELKIGSFRSTFISDRGSKNVFRLTLLSNFIPESEFEDSVSNTAPSRHCRNDNPHDDDDDESQYSCGGARVGGPGGPASDRGDPSQEYRLLKNSQTLVQVSKFEEKQLWLGVLRKVVAREVQHVEF